MCLNYDIHFVNFKIYIEKLKNFNVNAGLTMNSISIKSYAKINLTLAILNRRTDSYHNLSSIFQTISLHDVIHLEKANEISLTSNVETIPTNSSNLAFKAAEIFLKHCKIKDGIKIKIKKNIPIKAGFGGGSSNAAAVLIGLNKMFKTNLSNSSLIKLATKIGADVPFLLKGGTALVEGIGEKINFLKPLADCKILIVKPSNGFATSAAFSKYDSLKLIQTKNSNHVANLINKNCEISEICNHLFNDFEKIYDDNFLKFKKIMIDFGALNCNLTGSGSAFFGIFNNVKNLISAQNHFKNQNFFTYVASPIKQLQN